MFSEQDTFAFGHPDNAPGQDLVFWVLRSIHAKNGTDLGRRSVSVFALASRERSELSDMLFLGFLKRSAIL